MLRAQYVGLYIKCTTFTGLCKSHVLFYGQSKPNIFTIKEYLKIRKLIHSKLHFLPIVKHYTLQLFLAKNLSINIDIDFFVQGLIFLVVFGFILVLQFVCMLIHRFTTLCHFIARAPYRCGQEYRTSISLMSPLSSEERAVQRLLPEVRRLMQNQ